MVYRISVYKNGQINREYSVVGFRGAVRSAVKRLAREIEMNIVDLDKDCSFESSYISSHEWSCTVTHRDEEVYGITVHKET